MFVDYDPHHANYGASPILYVTLCNTIGTRYYALLTHLNCNLNKPFHGKIQAKTIYTMLIIFGVVFVNCKQVVIGSHKKGPSIINFL